MTTVPCNPKEVAALRDEMRILGVTLSPEVALKLLLKVGHRAVCVDALLMNPRPAWLEAIAGPIVKASKKDSKEEAK